MTGKVNENEMANIRHAVSREAGSWRIARCAGSCETELRTGFAQAWKGPAWGLLLPQAGFGETLPV